MDQVSIHIHLSFKNITVMIILTQESKLAQSGLSAACIIGATKDAVKDGVEKGSYQLVFFTPELLISQKRGINLLTKEHYKGRVVGFSTHPHTSYISAVVSDHCKPTS